ncbi:MAG: chorismate mutase [Oscillospiraceae bacterium]|nr:chorismate mutase [Oscillospiraceae bacterium]MBR4101664.1 chorismate mutase [Oscillospiraceae bacterium]
MDLQELRREIDSLDKEIINAFSRRMELCRGVAAYKKANGMQVFQSAREEEIFRKVYDLAPEGLGDSTRLLFKNIIDISKHLQYREIFDDTPATYKELTLPADAAVACQGTEGANAETAAKQIFGEGCKPTYFATFADVFEAVQSGKTQFGVIPVQNSTAGSVVQAYDLMGQYNFFINRTTVVEVTNCLAVRPGTKLSDIRSVYSHPQALAQCSEFLTKNGLQAIPHSNTATAAQMVAQSDQPIAAICSEPCAALYGLEILQDHISDYVPNYTRFICISKEMQLSPDADCISVMLKLPHEEGTLYRLLSKFVICGMNLQKLESRPIRNGSFEVMFYLDFNGSILDKNVRALLSDLSENLEYFKFLGNYSET